MKLCIHQTNYYDRRSLLARPQTARQQPHEPHRHVAKPGFPGLDSSIAPYITFNHHARREASSKALSTKLVRNIEAMHCTYRKSSSHPDGRLGVLVVGVVQQSVLRKAVLLLIVVLGEEGSVLTVLVVLLQPAELDLEVAVEIRRVHRIRCSPRGDGRLLSLNGLLELAATVFNLPRPGKVFLNMTGVLSSSCGGHGAAADVVEVEVQASLPLQFLLLLLLLGDNLMHCREQCPAGDSADDEELNDGRDEEHQDYARFGGGQAGEGGWHVVVSQQKAKGTRGEEKRCEWLQSKPEKKST